MNQNLGTVSHGTMRLKDLIPAFVDCLKEQTDLTVDEHTLMQNVLARIEVGEWYFESECASFDLEALLVALDYHAPEDCYFGSHEGDGSNYGFWPVEEGV